MTTQRKESYEQIIHPVLLTTMHPCIYLLQRPDARAREVGKVGPVAELSGITTDADPVGVRGRRTVKDPKLVPARGRDERVGRRGDRARVTIARELGEDRAHAHGVAWKTEWIDQHALNETGEVCMELQSNSEDSPCWKVELQGRRRWDD